MQYNDLDLRDWKELKINTDSLWIINQRHKSGKNIINIKLPNQLIQRYTKQNDTVFEPFMGSGTKHLEKNRYSALVIGDVYKKQ